MSIESVKLTCGVYDLNDDEFGDKAGGPILLEQIGAPAGALGPGAPAIPAALVPLCECGPCNRAR